MSPLKHLLTLLVLLLLWPFNSGDSVGCFVRDSCVLPCTFKPGDDPLIHWIQMGGKEEIYVHSYYNGNDQLSHQKDRFRNRTSLFKDQIQRGNASLLLSRVEVQDQGRYKCYTSTENNNELFIDVTVEAPVREVDIRWVENKITCMSEGIYPEPELTWTTSPLSHLSPPDRPTVQQTEQQLYSISSSLTVSDGSIDSYSCVVSAGNSSRKVTTFKPTSVSATNGESTVSCGVLNSSPASFSFTWTFNHSQVIVTQSRNISKEWRQHVKSVSNSGSLVLHNLSAEQEGVYSCELSTAEETHVTNTLLRTEGDNLSAGSIAVIATVVVVAVAVVVAVPVIFFIYQRCKKKQTGTGLRDRGRPAVENFFELQEVQASQEEEENMEMLSDHRESST